MSEVPRVPPTGGAEGSGRKDRASVDDDKFKKLMRVEEVHEIDPHEKRNRKRREETEDEAEEEVKKAGASHARKGVKPLKNDTGNPLERKKVGSRAIPSTSSSSSSPQETPAAAFRPEEIEAYAWEEDAQMASKEKSPTASPEVPAAKILTSDVTAKQPLSKAPSPEPESLSAPPPTPEAPQPALFSIEADLIKDEVPQEEPAKPYAEEWPHTTSYRPTSAFRSDVPKPEPAKEDDDLQPRKPELDRRHDKEEEKKKSKDSAPLKKKTSPPSDEEAILPGAPLAKGKKEKTPSFAELMEEGVEKKSKEAKPGEKKPTSPQEKTLTSSILQEPKEEVPPALSSKTTREAPEVPQAAFEPPSSSIQGIPSAEESFAFLKKTGGGTIPSQKADEDVIKEEGTVLSPLSPLPEGGTDMGGEGGGEKRKGKAEAEEAAIAAAAGASAETAPLAPHVEAPVPATPAPYAQMNPQILALFERMVGVMTIIQTTGITETVLTLNARQFANSVLYGSQIIIREFSTAPTAFNVEFIGSGAALTLVQQNIPGLLGAVQQGNFNFTINRFDVKLSGTEKPMFSRKEPPREKGNQKDNEKEQETP